MPTELKFDFKENLDNHLHAVSQALQANIYTTVDLKVKVIIKEENKNPIVQDTKTRYKCDTLVADETGCAKLVLWENTINRGKRKVLPFQKCTVLCKSNANVFRRNSRLFLAFRRKNIEFSMEANFHRKVTLIRNAYCFQLHEFSNDNSLITKINFKFSSKNSLRSIKTLIIRANFRSLLSLLEHSHASSGR